MAKSLKPRATKRAASNARTTADVADDVEEFGGTLPSGDAIKKHVQSINALTAKSAEVRGQIGAAVKAGESDHNIHRGAASLCMKLVRMDESKRDEFLRHFDSYRLQLGMGRQTDLFNDESPAERATFGGRQAAN